MLEGMYALISRGYLSLGFEIVGSPLNKILLHLQGRTSKKVHTAFQLKKGTFVINNRVGYFGTMGL
jgi:hypothetical protein